MRAARWVPALALAVAVAAAGGCYRRGARSAAPPVPLSVQNMGFFDVVVYAVPSSPSNRVRIGTVTGNSNARLTVPHTAVRPGGTLVLYLHAIGSRRYWLSPAVTVSDGLMATLDIHSGRDGDLSRSVFYTTHAEPATPDYGVAAGR